MSDLIPEHIIRNAYAQPSVARRVEMAIAQLHVYSGWQVLPNDEHTLKHMRDQVDVFTTLTLCMTDGDDWHRWISRQIVQKSGQSANSVTLGRVLGEIMNDHLVGMLITPGRSHGFAEACRKWALTQLEWLNEGEPSALMTGTELEERSRLAAILSETNWVGRNID